MRITNSMLISNSVWNISNNMKRLAKAEQQQSTQSKIQLPSDDPVVASQAVKYRNYVSSVSQYQQNVEDASSWMKVTSGALSDLNSVMQEVREKTVQAANGTQSESSLSAIKTEVEQLKESALQVLNTSYAGRYVFSGYSTDTEPYAETSVTVGSTTVSKITYNGKILDLGGPVSASTDSTEYAQAYTDNKSNMYDTTTASQPISYNTGFGSQVQVNVEGRDVVGTAADSNLFATFDKLLIALSGGTSYKTVDSSGTVTTSDVSITSVLGDIDDDLERISTAESDLGARQSYVSLASSRLSDDATTYEELMSKNEDVDVAEATTNLSTAESVYDASLTAGAKAITKSLLDYLA